MRQYPTLFESAGNTIVARKGRR